MILVTGATGQFGKATIEKLLERGVKVAEIRALVRDTNKVNDLAKQGVKIKVGDYDNYASLLNAMQGVEKLLLVSGTDLNNRAVQHKRVIDAAKEAGVKHVVYTSFARKNETESNPLGYLATSHVETDNYLIESGLSYTIMQNGLYAEVIPMFAGENVKETGIFFPAGKGKSAFVVRTDLAEAAAIILSNEGHENKIYKTSGIKNIGFDELASQIGQIVNREVGYESPDLETYKTALAQAGVPDMYIGMNIGFGEAIRQGEFDIENSDLETILGRPATELSLFLKSVYGV